MSESSRICGRLYDLTRTHNGRNVALDINGVPVLVIQRLEDADHILRLHVANYRKNMDWFRQALGASRFSEDGEAWELRWNLTQPYFSKFDRQRTFELAARRAQLAADKLILASEAGAGTIDDDILREMAVGVLVENFFGILLEDLGLDIPAITELMEFGSEFSFVPPGQTAAVYRQRLPELPALRRRVLQGMGGFRSLDTASSPILAGMKAADEDASNNFLLEHELMSFLAAGAESSAAAMSWACYLLAKDEALQDNLRALSMAFWCDAVPDWLKLKEITPLRTFVSETLRLFPPTPIISRYAVAADRLDDLEIPAGQNVMISFIGIQHDQRHRSDPWRLDMAGRGNCPVSGETSAFSFGPRVCGGKQFAMAELITFLCVFLTRARFELISHEPPAFHWRSQMVRDGGQPVRVIPLSAGFS